MHSFLLQNLTICETGVIFVMLFTNITVVSQYKCEQLFLLTQIFVRNNTHIFAFEMKNIDNQGKKFQEFLERKKSESKRIAGSPVLTIQLAAEKMGISRRTLYQYFESKTLSVDVINNILKTFNTTTDEVFEGYDSNIKNNVKPINFNASTPNLYLVPLKAQGGFMSGYEREVYLNQLEKISFPMVQGECFGFEIDGLSMTPEYYPGDYVIGTPVERPEHLMKGKVYIFQTIDGILLKEFGGIDGNEATLKSINKDYTPITIPTKEIKKAYLKEFKITRN